MVQAPARAQSQAPHIQNNPASAARAKQPQQAEHGQPQKHNLD